MDIEVELLEKVQRRATRMMTNDKSLFIYLFIYLLDSIHRCFLSGDHNSLDRAFVVYMRPILEYNSVVW